MSTQKRDINQLITATLLSVLELISIIAQRPEQSITRDEKLKIEECIKKLTLFINSINSALKRSICE